MERGSVEELGARWLGFGSFPSRARHRHCKIRGRFLAVPVSVWKGEIEMVDRVSGQ